MTFKRIIRVLWNWLFHRREMREQADIERIEMEAGKLDVYLKHPGMRIIAEEIGIFMADLKPPNYVEMQMFDPATRRSYTLTVRFTERPTPHQIILGLKDVLWQINDHPESAEDLVVAAIAKYKWEFLKATREVVKDA